MQPIDKLSYDELKSWLRGRLQEQGAASADIDRRRDETAYEAPLAAWKVGNDDFRQQFARVVKALLDETRAAPWPPAAMHNLVALIEEGEILEALKELVQIVRAEAWLRLPEGGRCHMLALRTMLSLKWKGTPEFWLKQGELLNGQFPALVFQGLLLHGLELAFAKLDALATDAASAKHLLKLFPRLIELNTLPTIRQLAGDALNRLPSSAAQTFDDWFAAWGYGRLRAAPLQGLSEVVLVGRVSYSGYIQQSSPAKRWHISKTHYLVLGASPQSASDAGWNAAPANDFEVYKHMFVHAPRPQPA